MINWDFSHQIIWGFCGCLELSGKNQCQSEISLNCVQYNRWSWREVRHSMVVLLSSICTTGLLVSSQYCYTMFLSTALTCHCSTGSPGWDPSCRGTGCRGWRSSLVGSGRSDPCSCVPQCGTVLCWSLSATDWAGRTASSRLGLEPLNQRLTLPARPEHRTTLATV